MRFTLLLESFAWPLQIYWREGGDETLLFVDYGGDGNLVVKTDPYNNVQPGDRVNFSFKDEGVRLFDKSSGDNIQLSA